MGSGGGNRLEAEAADMVLEIERNRRENSGERLPEFLVFKFVDVERVGPDLLAGLGVIELVRRGDDELTATSQ